MIVCVCRRVSDRDIVNAVKDGAVSFDAVQFDTGAATQCGRCGECARKVFENACSQHLSSACSPMSLVRMPLHAMA